MSSDLPTKMCARQSEGMTQSSYHHNNGAIIACAKTLGRETHDGLG
ncbi:hypothetical protein QA646_03340 [Rhizobium sp. CB3090]|nr:hypothetical protein [Rhizobium sp. CB3090]WFU09915.1 hypothetical protein QA646_03340 [Rhizobium sp. CB3090]